MNNKGDISQHILNYLRKNPDSADTLEGISAWWLLSERVNDAVNNVADALESLIKGGSIVRLKLKNGKIVYKLPGR